MGLSCIVLGAEKPACQKLEAERIEGIAKAEERVYGELLNWPKMVRFTRVDMIPGSRRGVARTVFVSHPGYMLRSRNVVGRFTILATRPQKSPHSGPFWNSPWTGSVLPAFPIQITTTQTRGGCKPGSKMTGPNERAGGEAYIS